MVNSVFLQHITNHYISFQYIVVAFLFVELVFPEVHDFFITKTIFLHFSPVAHSTQFKLQISFLLGLGQLLQFKIYKTTLWFILYGSAHAHLIWYKKVKYQTFYDGLEIRIASLRSVLSGHFPTSSNFQQVSTVLLSSSTTSSLYHLPTTHQR